MDDNKKILKREGFIAFLKEKGKKIVIRFFVFESRAYHLISEKSIDVLFYSQKHLVTEIIMLIFF